MIPFITRLKRLDDAGLSLIGFGKGCVRKMAREIFLQYTRF